MMLKAFIALLIVQSVFSAIPAPKLSKVIYGRLQPPSPCPGYKCPTPECDEPIPRYSEHNGVKCRTCDMCPPKCPPQQCPPIECELGYEPQEVFVTVEGEKCRLCDQCVSVERKCPILPCPPIADCGPDAESMETTEVFDGIICPACPLCVRKPQNPGCPLPLCIELGERLDGDRLNGDKSCPPGEERAISAFNDEFGNTCELCEDCHPVCQPADCADEPSECKSGELTRPKTVQNGRLCPGCAVCLQN